MRRVDPSGRDEGSNEWPPAAGAADTTPTPDVLDPRSRAPDAPAADRLAHGDTLARSGGRPQRVEPLGPQFGRTRLGHHVLLEKLGQGGMGVVFAAFDTRLDRKVAIKLLRAPDGERSRERMLREARAMARVSHPNVVQVYEVGEDDQLSFMVMEFVEGATLTAWLGERPRTRREVLAVFAAAGRGLAAAHREGLVHRDFKPDNVMIRGDGRVLVMDFGLARRDPREAPEPVALADARGADAALTLAGALLGTPMYMAPEQFAGLETDERTDQFSFCVALWEALYGQRPFRGDHLAELATAVMERRITPPERSDVPVWLRRVLERGLSTDPASRFPTMDALLVGLAHDPDRRRRGWTLAVGLVGLVGLSLAGVSSWRERERRAVAAECGRVGQEIAADWNEQVALRVGDAFAATGLGFAVSAWDHTRPWVDAWTRGWSEMRTQMCLETHLEGVRDVASHDAIVACLDAQRTSLRGLLAAWAEPDRLRVTHATRAAASLAPLSNCADVRLAERIEPPTELRDTIAALRERLDDARASRIAGEFEVGLAQAQASAEEAERLGWRPLRAEAALLVGGLRGDLGDHAAARESLQEAFFHALAGGDDRHMLAAATQLTHQIGYQLAQHEQGRHWGTIGEMLVERLRLGGTLDDATHIASVAGVLTKAGRYEEALEYFRRALRTREELLGPNHPELARVLNSIGVVRFNQGEAGEAIEWFRRSLAIEEAALGPDHPDLAHALNNLAAVLGTRGQIEEALAYHRRALAIRIDALGSEHPDVASSLSNIGALLAAQGDPDGAMAHERRAMEVFAAALGRGHPEVATTHSIIGGIESGRGDHAAALASHRAALAIFEAAFGPEHPEVARATHNIGHALLALGEPGPALAAFRRALAVREAALGRDNVEVGRTLAGLGQALLALGERDAARDPLRRAEEIGEHSGDARLLAEVSRGLARLDARSR
jgi:tetratricopeptide (TPR) repeat protein/predicted Ser/Thr protein kinase